MKPLLSLVLTLLALIAATPAFAATHTAYYTAATGGTYYLHPASQGLASWTTYRVALTEGSGANTGRYSGTLDDANGADWRLFSGSSQPANWGVAIGSVDLTSAMAAASAATAATQSTSAATQSTTAATHTAASAIRSALGLTSANLDTQLDALPTASEVTTDLLATTTTDTGPGKVGRALHYLRTAWASAGVFSEAALAEAPSGGGGGIDRADADLIAARIAAARGAFYPNRSSVWVLERGEDGEDAITVVRDVVLSKKPTETRKLWVDFAALLGRNEAIESIDSLDATDVTLVAESEEIVGTLVGFATTGGTNGDDAVVTLQVTTTADQVLPVEVRLRVKD